MPPRRARLVEGKHRVKESHVVIRRHLCEFLCSLSRKLLLTSQLLRYVQSALSLGAKVVDDGIEELMRL